MSRKSQLRDSDFALLDDVPTPLFVLESLNAGDVTYAFFNKVAIEISKFKLHDYVGLTAKKLYHGQYGEFAYEKHVECFITAQPSTYVLPLPLNGKLRSIRTCLMPIVDNNGQTRRIIGASTEITAEQELAKIRAESRDIEKELQEFIYLAAHDLRSPMKKAHIVADMLRDDFDDMDEEKLELIELLENVSVQSMEMIQTVLKHAETTAIEESIEHISLRDVCNGILQTLDPTNIHEYLIDSECSIHGDRVLIQTILRNLIDNTFKHNEPNSIVLDISVKNTKSGFFAMTVADNGCGMQAPEKLFRSTDVSRSKSGFGLLAIRNLIKRAGGDVFAEHADGDKGLAVKVTLPGTIAW
ncbi:MAG: ATP-binding protein [Granulosicoccus sp.]